ncbi:MAG: hypothetical protein ACRDWA_04325 [Acidimicrobiia bacterium]
MVDAPERLLVLTNPTFYEIFIGRMGGAIPKGIEVLALQLPVEIQSEVDRVVASASSKMGSAAVRAAFWVAAEDEAEATI